MNNKVRAHVFFSGRVQGVFFRKTIWIKARKLGIFGWVKNLPDKRVEAIFEGEKEKIQELVNNIEKGNPLIKVDNIDLEWKDYRGEFEDFKVI